MARHVVNLAHARPPRSHSRALPPSTAETQLMSTTAPPHPMTGAAPRVDVPMPGAVAGRNRRRPMLVLAAVLLLLVSALTGAFAFGQLTTTTSVVGLARTVPAGQVVVRDDLTVVQLSPAAGLATVPATALDSVVGKRAVSDLVAGTTLTPDGVVDTLVPARGRAVVGVLTTPGTAPVAGLVPGAAVVLVPLTATQGGTPAASAAPAMAAPGRVVAAVALSDGSGTRIDVEVEAGQAEQLQRLAAEKRLAVVLVSKER